MQAASLPRPDYNAFRCSLQFPAGLWCHATKGILGVRVVQADQRAAESVSPSPTEAKAPALAVVAHPRAGAGRGEGTFAVTRRNRGVRRSLRLAARIMPCWPEGALRLGLCHWAPGDHNAHVVRWVLS